MEMLRIQDREIQSNENKEIEGENEARTEGGKDEERRTEGRKEGRREAVQRTVKLLLIRQKGSSRKQN